MVSFSNLTFDLRRILFDTRKIRRCFANKKELLYTERYQIENIIFLYVRRKIKTGNVIYHGCRYDPFDINYQNEYGWTALTYASANEEENIVKILLDTGADPNIQTKSGWTALIWASQYKEENIARMLLEAGADPNIRNKNGWTGLIAASCCGNENIVKILLDAGADPNIRDKHGRTALDLVSENGYENIFRILSTSNLD